MVEILAAFPEEDCWQSHIQRVVTKMSELKRTLKKNSPTNDKSSLYVLMYCKLCLGVVMKAAQIF